MYYLQSLVIPKKKTLINLIGNVFHFRISRILILSFLNFKTILLINIHNNPIIIKKNYFWI